jgi:hypothetical protein
MKPIVRALLRANDELNEEEATVPEPTFWPGLHDHDKVGPIGDGTPHARMCWFWERMRGHERLIAELTGWSPVSSSYCFEAAIADAFDRLAEERGGDRA